MKILPTVLSENDLIKMHYPCVGCGEFTSYQIRDITFCASLNCLTINNVQYKGEQHAWKQAIKGGYFGKLKDAYDINDKSHVAELLLIKHVFCVGYEHYNPLSPVWRALDKD